MAEIAHKYVEVTAAQTTASSTYVDVPGATIAAADLVAGKKYLIVAISQLKVGSVSGDEVAMQVVHGSTAFPSSEHRQNSPGAQEWRPYAWFTVWTAVASEDLQVQFNSPKSTTITAAHTTIFVMNLSDDLTENTDWFFSENSTSVDLDAIQPNWTTTNNATVTFTPAAGDDWLVMCRSRIEVESANDNYLTRVVSTGTFAETQPLASQEGEGSTDFMVHHLCRVFKALGAVSQTFKTESRMDGSGVGGGTENRTHNAVFALNLDKFESQGSIWTEAELALSETAFATTVQTLTFAPISTGDVWILGQWITDIGGTGHDVQFRLQVAGADQPPSQVARNFGQLDSTDEMPVHIQTVESLSASSVIDLDGSKEAAATTVAEDRVVMAVSMVLAAGGPTPQAVTGALSFSGALALRARKPLAGTASFAGAVTERALLPLTSALSFSGTIAVGARKAFAGVLTFTGILARKTSMPLIGALSFVGALSSRARLVLSGTASWAGALSTKIVATVGLAGVLSFGGALARRTMAPLVGVLSFGGTLARRTFKPLAGGLSFAGALVAQLGVTQLALSGVMSWAGALGRTARKTLAGGWTGAGTLGRRTGQALAGTVTPSGSMAVVVSMDVEGDWNGTGALSTRIVQVAVLTGSITPSGALTRMARLQLTGALAPAGALTRLARRSLIGNLAFTGTLVFPGLAPELSQPLTLDWTIQERKLDFTAQEREIDYHG